MKKPTKRFEIKGNMIVSEGISVAVIGSESRDELLQLITSFLNTHYFPPQSPLEEVLSQFPDEVRDLPEVRNIIAQTEKAQEALQRQADARKTLNKKVPK